MTNEGGSGGVGGGVGGGGCGFWLQRWRVSILLMPVGVTVYLFLLTLKVAKEPKYPCFSFECWLLQAQLVCNKKWVALWDWVRGLQRLMAFFVLFEMRSQAFLSASTLTWLLSLQDFYWKFCLFFLYCV